MPSATQDRATAPALTPTSAPASEARIHALDALRAAAMFLGIVLHALMFYTAALPIQGALQDPNNTWIFDPLFGLIHGFRMQLFFLLGGFFARLLHERLGPADFLKHRLKRVGLPFLLGMVTLMPLTFAMFIWQAIRTGQSLSPPENTRHDIPTGHLWFLQLLLIFYAIIALLSRVRMARVSTFAVADRAFDRILRSPARCFPFAALGVLWIWNGPFWGEAKLPFLSLLIDWETIAHFGVFFLVGWWIHRRRQSLDQLKRFVVPSFLIALGAFAIHSWLRKLEIHPTPPEYLPIKFASLFTASLYAWAMVFAAIGWFLNHASRSSPTLRYLADASYWCYLAHLPIVIFFQILLFPYSAPALLKFLIVLTGTMAILLVTYHYRVRHHWLGRLLNGPRVRESRSSL